MSACTSYPRIHAAVGGSGPKGKALLQNPAAVWDLAKLKETVLRALKNEWRTLNYFDSPAVVNALWDPIVEEVLGRRLDEAADEGALPSRACVVCGVWCVVCGVW